MVKLIVDITLFTRNTKEELTTLMMMLLLKLALISLKMHQDKGTCLYIKETNVMTTNNQTKQIPRYRALAIKPTRIALLKVRKRKV